MCITFLMFNPGASADQWQLVLINNRDEHLDRPTSLADWKDSVLAGRDMQVAGGGTWLGVTKTGRIAALTNIVEPPEKVPPNALSRGPLARDFLMDASRTPFEYGESLVSKDRYPGFALLVLEKRQDQVRKWNAAYCCNRCDSPTEVLEPGVYGFGNSPRTRPFLKVQRGLQLFQQVLSKHLLTTDSDKWEFVDDLVRILADRTPCYPDGQLESQTPHLTPVQRQRLSCCFVEYPAEMKYGTRTHTVILIDGSDNVTHVEKTMNEKDFKAPWIETKHEFRLNPS